MEKQLLTFLSLCMGLAALAQAPQADVLDVVFNDDGTVSIALVNGGKGEKILRRMRHHEHRDTV